MPYLRIPLAALALILLQTPAPADSAKGEDKTVVEVAKKANASVVVVTFTGRDGKQQGLGTGFIISPDGLIATNLHVLGEARPIQVHLADGKAHAVTSVHASDRSLDLAVLRIDAKALPSLPLGDSDKLDNGQTVIALGHPRGLKHSVVSGVVSARPTIEGRSMIQLAMPIEQGNSGGPLLDLEGRVQGIITLKSLVTPNLGFAMPVNALKTLLKRPNPIPLERWVTIGTLNPEDWTTVFEGRWRQRNGQLSVDGPGAGFGGRTLALSRLAVPPVPYEVAVNVRLDSEAGAAGLAIHADGGDKHYGFYPSAGKLRFSLFEGPDFNSWQVLHNEASAHYRAGDWNTLKVRVEKDRILCYVNDHLVYTSKDTALTAGKVGLCKFRDTHADFKHFRLAGSIAPERPPAELAARVGKLVEGIAPDGPPKSELVDALAPDAPASLALLEERARRLEQQAARLRELAQAVHEKRTTDELVRAMQEPEDKRDLIHAALLLARLDNPELDVEAYRRQVDRLAQEVAAAVPKAADEKAKLAVLTRELFQQRGFHGSRADYYNRANSYLNDVLDDREGLPITLSLLYAELARRLGVKVVGVGLPGHFVVRHEPVKGPSYLIDVYEGGKTLSRDEAEKQVLAATGQPLKKQYLAAVSGKDVIVRMLHNLANIAHKAEQPRNLLRYQNAILAIAPELVEDRLLRAGARYETGDGKGAIADLDWLLENAGGQIDREQVLKLRQIITRP